MSRVSLLPAEGGAFFARDPAPQLRPAGKIHPAELGGARADITQTAVQGNRVPTPDSIRAYRRNYSMPLGQSSKHFGTRSDSPRSEDTIYGAKNIKDGSVDACLHPNAGADKLGNLAAEHAERRYLSNRKEPLGRVPDPSIPIPEQLQRDGFGIPTKRSENAKVVIYNSANKEAKLLHPPGEQTNRGYNWTTTGIDPTNHRFGSVVRGEPTTTKELVNPQGGASVLPKIVRDFDSITYPELAKTRNLGFGTRPQDADYTYGKQLKRDELNAQQLIRGEALGSSSGASGVEDGALSETGTMGSSEYNQLGGTYVKSVTQRKLRSQDKQSSVGSFGSPTRALGIPSIRTDIPKPDESRRKVTNGVNYGDDVGAKHLLYPNQYVGNGILTKYYGAPKSLDEIREFCHKIQLGLSEVEIATAFEVARTDPKFYGSPEAAGCTVEAFRAAANYLGM